MTIIHKNSLIYLFQINTASAKNINLTSANDEVVFDGIFYLPNSGLSLARGNFNDSASDEIILTGVFEQEGVAKKDNLAGARVKIFYGLPSKIKFLVTFYVSSYISKDLEFELICESEAKKYQKSLLQTFSKKCRASFGDEKCKINLEKYRFQCKIQEIKNDVFVCRGLSCKDGYLNDGTITLKSKDNASTKTYKIISHFDNNIRVLNYDANFDCDEDIILTAGCDKNFRTCCYSYNNALNFRGEPFIPEKNIIEN